MKCEKKNRSQRKGERNKMDIIHEVCEWNLERGNIVYDKDLEGKMIDEELTEYAVACLEPQSIVDQADALADLVFVTIGSLFKLTGGDEQKVRDILLVVSAANNLKGKDKNEDGKVQKPEGFSGPEGMIEEILGC